MKKSGFSLLEIMVVIAIIAVLAMLAMPRFVPFLAKAKRAEAYMQLHSLYAAQKVHWAIHGTYSSELTGKNGIGWLPEGYHGGGETEQFYYTYGFPGAEGKNYVSGKLPSESGSLGLAHAGKDTFVAVAAGDIDGDGKPDVITINQNNVITIVQDDLA